MSVNTVSPLSQIQATLETLGQSKQMKIICVTALAILIALTLTVSTWANVHVASVYGTGAILNHSIYTTLIPLAVTCLITHLLAVLLTVASTRPSDAQVILPQSEPPHTDSALPNDRINITAPPVVMTNLVEYAPLSGKIHSLKCAVGDVIVKGQELCTIEAMKMVVTLTAQESGRVAEIFVQEGVVVTTQQQLLRIEKPQE